MDTIPHALLIARLGFAGLAAPIVVPQARDAWIAEDKLQHAGMSAAATTFSYAGTRLVGFDRNSGLAISLAFAAAAAIGKEVRDRRAGGAFSFRDLVWDVIGIAGASAMMQATR